MQQKTILYILLQLSCFYMNAQNKGITIEAYIEKYKDIAIREMERSGVPASITLAQGIRESSAGNSDLAKDAYNHFGIKCAKDWGGEEYYKWDDDADKSCFRVYKTAEESYIDHSDILMRRKHYQPLFKLDKKDYKAWAVGLREAGYASDPDYPKKLISTIEQYQLHQYDDMKSPPLLADGGSPKPDSTKETTVSNEQPEVLFDRYKKGIFRKNNSSYMIAKKGESLLAMAERLNIKYKNLLKFNELKEGQQLIPFQHVFIEPKKNTYKGEEETHIIREGETMYMLAQYYAVREITLRRLNRMTDDVEPVTGETIYLKRPSDKKPATKKKELVLDSVTPFVYVPSELPLEVVDSVKKNEPTFKPVLNTDKTIGKPAMSTEYNSDSKPANPYSAPGTPPGYINTSSNPDGSTSIKYFQDVSEVVETAPEPEVIPQETPVQPETITPEKPQIPEPTVPEPVIPEPVVPKPIVPNTVAPSQPMPGIHKVQDQESLYSISKLYGIDVEAIKKANNLNTNTVTKGQRLIIPVKGASLPTTSSTTPPPTKPTTKPTTESAAAVPIPVTPEKPKNGQPSIHEVKEKETLYSISRLYKTSVDDIKKANNLNSNDLRKGQKLTIPAIKGVSTTLPSADTYTATTDRKTPAPALLEPNVSSWKVAHPQTDMVKTAVHEVKEKETLYSISNRYGVSVLDIKSRNKLSSNTLRKGQKLIIPNGKNSVSEDNENTPTETEMPVQYGYLIPTVTREKVESQYKTEQPMEYNSVAIVGFKASDSTAQPNSETEQEIEFPQKISFDYEVQEKETLYSIARRFGVSVDIIKDVNKLASNTVRKGQKIIVPSL